MLSKRLPRIRPHQPQVCNGNTGHAEAVRFHYDPNAVKYDDLCTFFFRIHDPTTPNRQGNDVGTQYRSAIFYRNDEQKAIAERVKQEVQPRFKAPIATEIVPEAHWWDAEEYHQQYLVNNPGKEGLIDPGQCLASPRQCMQQLCGKTDQLPC